MKWMTLSVALIICAGVSNAEAGLFDCFKKRNHCGYDACCQPAPAPCCEPAPCDSCCAPKKSCFLDGLFGGCGKKHRHCCEPAPAPCCEPAPCDSCCGRKKSCLDGLFGGCHKNRCCEPAPAPCCEPAPVCNTCEPCCKPKRKCLFDCFFGKKNDCGCGHHHHHHHCGCGH